MDLFDDYQDDVELSDDQIEAILSNEDHSSRPITTLIRDVRLGMLEDPSPQIAARHLDAMAGAARPRETAPLAARLGGRRVLPRKRLTAIVLAAALLLGAGLAAAVTLPKKGPQPARDTVPSTVPSVTPAAADLPEEAAHGQAVADVAKDPSLAGCEKGQAVADAASAKAAENRKNPAKENDPCARGGTEDKPNSGRRGDVPTGRGGGSRGPDDSHPARGVRPATPPGLGDEGPGLGGSEAGGRGGGNGSEVGGGRGAGGPVGGGGAGGSEVGGGGVPEDLPTP